MRAPHRILYLIHNPAWTECRIADVLRDRGCEIEFRCHPYGDPLPKTARSYAAVIVGGSDEGHAGEPHRHPWVGREIAFVRKAVEAGVPFLGICMGSQLLAAAFGGTILARPDGLTELGYYQIEATPEGVELFAGTSHFYQAHFEGVFALPDDAVLLARGHQFPVQAFRIGRHAYGLQFHPDQKLTSVTHEALAQEPYLSRLGVQSAHEQVRLAPVYEASIQRWSERFVEHWIGWAKASAAA